MSFSVKLIGSRRAVIAALEKDTTIPGQLKDIALGICRAPSSFGNAIDFDASGHVDSTGGGNVYRFSVNPIFILEEPADEKSPVADPQSPANPPDGA